MTHKRMVGDTLTPLNAVLKRNGNPVDLAGLTVKFRIEDDYGTVTLAETATGVTAHPTQAFTVDTTNNLLLRNDHGVKPGQQIIVSTTTTLPTGLAAATRYFARDVNPNGFKLAATPDGAPIVISTAGSGTHSFYVVGSVQYDFAAPTVTTAGRYRGWFTVYSGLEFDTFPPDAGGIAIEVTPYGN